jgi:hypothetical protein
MVSSCVHGEEEALTDHQRIVQKTNRLCLQSLGRRERTVQSPSMRHPNCVY